MSRRRRSRGANATRPSGFEALLESARRGKQASSKAVDQKEEVKFETPPSSPRDKIVAARTPSSPHKRRAVSQSSQGDTSLGSETLSSPTKSLNSSLPQSLADIRSPIKRSDLDRSVRSRSKTLQEQIISSTLEKEAAKRRKDQLNRLSHVHVHGTTSAAHHPFARHLYGSNTSSTRVGAISRTKELTRSAPSTPSNSVGASPMSTRSTMYTPVRHGIDRLAQFKQPRSRRRLFADTSADVNTSEAAGVDVSSETDDVQTAAGMRGQDTVVLSDEEGDHVATTVPSGAQPLTLPKLEWDARTADSGDAVSVTGEQPAWRRQADAILGGSPFTSRLTLPLSYARLLDIFHGLETAMSQWISRKQAHIYHSTIKGAVEKLCRRTFLAKHLGQVVELVPECYAVELLKVPCKDRLAARKYEYAITWKHCSIDTRTLQVTEPETRAGGSKAPITNQDLLLRRKLMEARLLERVYRHHEVFLEEWSARHGKDLALMREAYARANLKMWHRDFPLEETPDIANRLPAIPSASERLKTSAKDTLTALYAKSRVAKLAVSKKLALESAAEKPADSTTTRGQDTHRRTSSGGISQRLLQRVRKRESISKAEAEAKQKDKRLRLRMLEILPSLADLTRTVLKQEGRSSMPFDALKRLLQRTNKQGLSAETITEYMMEILKLVPDWCTLVTIGRGASERSVFRMKSKYSMESVRSVLEAERNTLHDEIVTADNALFGEPTETV